MPHTGDAPSLAQNKTFRLILLLAVAAAVAIMIVIMVYGAAEKAALGTTKKPIERSVIWSKWKEVVLTDEWSGHFDTPTKWDRVVPPAGGKVEVLFENGSYYDLKGDQTDNMYRAIDIKGDGKFQLKGTPGAKAEIWIGQIQQIVSKQ